MTNVAVMTRIQLIEAPYLEEYINWYIKIGFNHIYFINTEPNNLEQINTFIAPNYLENCTFYNYSGSVNEFNYARDLFANVIKEQYVLHVDSDEYFILPKQYSNINDFVSQNEYHKYVFHWTNVPVNALYTSNFTDYIQGKQVAGRHCLAPKMMVNREKWLSHKSRMSPHAFVCSGTQQTFKDPTSNGQVPFILHMVTRGHLHTLMKILVQRLPNAKSGTSKQLIKEFVTTTIPLKKYPHRIHIAVGEIALSSIISIIKWNIPDYQHIDRTLQTTNMYNKILAKYGLSTDDNILQKDIFQLQEKITKCTNSVTNEHLTIIKGKMPSIIGKKLEKVL